MRSYKTLVLSMKHLKKSTRLLLDNDPEDLEFCVFKMPEIDSLMISLDDDFAGVPDDLKKCIDFALKQDAQWLRFDGEEKTSEPLPIYRGDEEIRFVRLSQKHLKRSTIESLLRRIDGYGIIQCHEADGLLLALGSGLDNAPDDLQACIQYANGHSYNWIRFDPVCGVTDELPVYEGDEKVKYVVVSTINRSIQKVGTADNFSRANFIMRKAFSEALAKEHAANPGCFFSEGNEWALRDWDAWLNTTGVLKKTYNWKIIVC